MSNSDLSPAAASGGWVPPTDKSRVVSTRRRVPTNWVSGRTLQPIATSFVPSDFLVDGQVSRLRLCTPFSLSASLAQEFFLFMVSFNVDEEIIVIRNGWIPKKK